MRGHRDEGTTTTPFDMVVLKKTSRFHLIIEALRRTKRPPANVALLVDECNAMLKKHAVYIREHFEDLPEISGWSWSSPLFRGARSWRVGCSYSRSCTRIALGAASPLFRKAAVSASGWP